MKRLSFLQPAAVIALLLATVAGLTSFAQEADPLIPPAPTGALGTHFTYQGELRAAGQPVDGECELAFRLYDDALAGSEVGQPITTTVVVSAGLFTQPLDFGTDAFAGDARWLDIRVMCPGDNNFTGLERQELTAAPYAVYSRSTGSLHGRSVSTAEPLAGEVLEWDGAAWSPAPDDDTIYSAGFGLALDGDTFAVDPGTIQARVDQACGDGYAIAAVHEDGSVTCTPVYTGTITAVNTGPGLTGGGDAGPITLTVSFDGAGTADTVARSDHDHDATYSLLGHVHFSLDAADGSPAQALYVDNDGEVGIGTTSPGGPLHVSTGAAPNALVVLPNGDVGVGTDAPYEAQFHIINPDVTPGTSSSLKVGGLSPGSSTAYNATLHIRTSAGGVGRLYFNDRYQGTGVEFRKEADIGLGSWFRVINRHDLVDDPTVYEIYNSGRSSNTADRMGVLVPLGVGTSNPASALQVVGYAQLDVLTAAPPAADCDQAVEYGRMKVDVANDLLYICTASGWIAK